ncbi:hypothetical protein PR048_016426 [Dryococelus australis]|uniref:Microtubule-associated protein 1A/B/S-like MBL-like domain-containing protein n=1 Tax=Dryococelus australis TaxID=614101 RepID=A0ABQ9HJP5_9NEOP|nr:hypothetical protein PR048_016426 [Dryococelus australis]
MELESADAFINYVFMLAETCELQTLKDELIITGLMIGVANDALSETLQLDHDLILEKNILLLCQAEQTPRHHLFATKASPPREKTTDLNSANKTVARNAVGHGKLDMYVVSPARDSREVKEFLAKWNSNDMRLFLPGKKDKDGFHFPVQNLVSICALLVWQPANPSDTITRILFPGSCPQHKIFEGLDKIRHLEFLKHAVCSTKSISPSTSAVAMTARTGGKQKSTPAVIDKILPGESMVKTPPKPLDIGKQPVVKTATIPVSGIGQTKPSTPVSATTTPTTTKAPPQAKPKVEKLTSKTEPPKSKTETNKILESEKHAFKVEKHFEKVSEKTTKLVSEAKSKEHKSKIESRTTVTKSRIDSKPPRSLERKKEKAVSEKKGDVKSSPTTPKRIIEHKVNGTATKSEVAKVSRTPSKGRPSPTSTPAKSAKEANNRKVVESKYHVARAASTTRAPTAKATKREQQDNVSVPLKPERKPISRRPKPSSPSKSSKAPGSPAKSSSAKSTPTPSVKSDKDGVIRKPKAEIEKVATDSSAVSTPSTAEPETVPLKSKLAPEEIIPSTIKQITDVTSTALGTSVISHVNVETKLLESIETSIKMEDKVLQKENLVQVKVGETIAEVRDFETEPEKISKELTVGAQEDTEDDEVTEDKESEVIEVPGEKHITQDTEITEEERTEDIEDEDENLTEPGKTLDEEMDIHAQAVGKGVREVEDEEDEYLIIEKEEVEQMMEDSLQEEESIESHIPDKKEIEEYEGELQKHLRDEVESEKEKKSEELKEIEKEKITDIDFITEKVKVTDKKETEIVQDKHKFQQAEKKYSQDEIEQRKESDTMIYRELAEPAATEKVFTETDKLKTDKITPETKEKIQEEVQEIISSAEEIATKTKIETEKIEDGIQERVKLLDESIDEKKDSEDLDEQKETSSISPEEKVDLSSEKLREMTEETRGTDLKIDDHDESLPLKGTMQRDATDQKYTADESQPDEKFSTTVESGATTAPTLPEDERIPLDEIKEIVEEKYVKEETKEEKPITVPVTSMDQPTALPHVVVPSTIGVLESRGPQSLLHQRDIVKTPDEVADLPVHEEVDTGMYESEDDFPKLKDYEREKKHIISEVIMPSKQEIIDTISEQHDQEIIPGAKIEESLQELVKKSVPGDEKVEEDMEKEIKVCAPEIQKQYETVAKYDDDKKEKQQQEKKALVDTKEEKLLADTKDEQPDTREIKYVGYVLKETEDQFKTDFIDEKDIALVAKDVQESKKLKVDPIQDKTEDNIIEDREKVEPLEIGHIETKDLALSEKDKIVQGKEPEIKGTDGDQLIANIQFEDSVTSAVQHIKEKEVDLKEKDISSKVVAHEIISEMTVEKKLSERLHDEADEGDKLPLESKGNDIFTEVKSLDGKEEKETIKEHQKLEAESFALTEISTPYDTTKDELIPADQKLASVTVEKHTIESHEEKSVFGVEDETGKQHTQVDNKLLEDMLHAEEISKEPRTPKDFSQVHEESHTGIPVAKDEMPSHAEETQMSDTLQSKLEKEGYKSIKDIDEMEYSMEKLDSSEIHEVSQQKVKEHTAPVKEEPLEEVEEQDMTTVQSILQKAEDSIKQLTGHFIETERNLPDTDVIKEPSAALKTEDTTKKLPDSEKLEIYVKETGKEEPDMTDKDSEAKDKLLAVKHELPFNVKITEETLDDDSKVSMISLESEKVLQETKVSPEGTKEHENHIYESRIESEGESKVQVEEKVDITKDKTEAEKTELERAQIKEEQKTDRIGTQKDDKLTIVEVHKDYDTVKYEKMEDSAKSESTTKEERQLQQTRHDNEEFPAVKEKLQDVPKEVTMEKTGTLDTKYDKTIPSHEELETHEPGSNYIPGIAPAGKPVKVVSIEPDITAPGEISATYLEIIDKLQQKLPSTDEVSEVPKDIENKLEYHEIAHTVDSLVSNVKEDECVTEDIEISHHKKILHSTEETGKNILADDDQSLEHDHTKQLILETDTDKVGDHLPAQALPDISAPQSVKSDLSSTVSEDEAIGFQIERISSDQKITGLSTETRVSDKISDSDDDELKGTRSLKITRETEKETVVVDIKKLSGDKRETVDSKDLVETVTKEVDDDLGRDYEGDVEEDEEDDDYVGSEYVDSGLEEEPVYSRLAAAAVPEYVTVTPDSAPPSPGDHRIHERTRDVLITDKDEKISHITTDSSKVSSASALEKSDKDIPEKKQDIKEEKTPPELGDKHEKESETGDKLQSCITVAETGIKDTEVSLLQDQVVSGMSTPQSSESGQLLADAKSESGISTPHSIESNKTHEMKGELDSYKRDYEESSHELKSLTTVFTSKQMHDDHQNDEDELQPSSSKSPESIKLSDDYKFKSEELATELRKIDDHTKFFKHETGEASILDEVERESDERLKDVNQTFIASERGISVNALKETDTKIYDISFHPADTSKSSVEKQATPAAMDMNGEYKEKVGDNEKLLPTQFDIEAVVSEIVSPLTKSEMSKADELKSDEKPCASAMKGDKYVEKEQEKMEKDTLFESLPSKDNAEFSLLEEKLHTGVSGAELDDLGRKSSGISESEISDEASLVSTTHDIEIKSKEECEDVLLTDTAATTTLSQQSQQDISSSSTVRRMVVTASSEDGGAETEVCSSESFTVTSSQYSDLDKSTQKPTQKTVDSTQDIKDELESKYSFEDEPGTEFQKTVTSVIKTSETNGHIYPSDKEDYESSPDDDSRKSKKTIITKTVTTKTISHTDLESAVVKEECGIEDFEDLDDKTVTEVTKSTIISKVASGLEESLETVDEKLPSHEFPEEPDASQIVQTTKEVEPLYKKLEDHKTVYHESQEHVTHQTFPQSPKIITTSTTTRLKMSPGEDIHIDEPSSHYGSQESVAYETVLGSPKITTKTTTATSVLKKSQGDDSTIVDEPSSHYGSQESVSHEIAPGSPKITTKTTTITTVLKKQLGDDITIVDEPSSHYGSQESISHETIPGSPKITTKTTTTKTTTTVLKKSLGDDATIVDEPSSHYGSQESVSHEIAPGSPKITTKTTTMTVLKKSLGDDSTIVDEPSSHYGSQESVSHEIAPGSPKITTKTTTTTTVLKKSQGDDATIVDEPSSHYGSQESVSHEIAPGSPKITTKTTTTTTILKKSQGDDATIVDEPSSHYGSQESVSHEIAPGSPKITTKTTTTTTVLKKSQGDDATIVDEPSSHYGSQESVSHEIAPGSPKITTKTTTTTTVLKKSQGDDATIVDEPPSHYGSQESVSHEIAPGSPKITTKTTTTTTVLKKLQGDDATIVDEPSSHYGSQESVSLEIVPGSPKITTKTTTTTTVLKKSQGDDATKVDEPSSHYGSQESVSLEIVPGSPKITTKTTTTTTVLKKSQGDDATIVDEPSSHYGSQESVSLEIVPGSPKITKKTITTTTRIKKSVGDEFTVVDEPSSNVGDDATIVDEPSSHYGSQESVSLEIVPGSPKITKKTITTTTRIKKSVGDEFTVVDEPSSNVGSQESVSHETVPGSPKITTETTTTVLKKSLGDDIMLVDESSGHYGSHESVYHETVPGSPKITRKTITTTTVIRKALGDDITTTDEPSSHYGSEESVSHETVPSSPTITKKTTTTTTTVLKKSLGDDITLVDEPSHYGSQESVLHETVPGSPTITKKTTTTTTVLKKSLGDEITPVDEPSSHYGSEESVSHETVPGSPRITKKTTTTTTVLKKTLGDDIALTDAPSGKTVTTTVTTVTKKVSGDEEETTTTTKEIDSDGERIITRTVEKDGKVTEHFSVVDKVGDGSKECDTQELSHDGLFKSADITVESAEAISEPTGKIEEHSDKVIDITSHQAPLEDKATKLYEEKTTISEKDGIRSSTVTTVTKTLTKEVGDIDFPAILSSGVTVIKREATDTVRSGTPGSDTFSDRDIEYGGPSTPHSDISSGQVSRAPTHIWGESSEGRPDSEDEDRPGSPLSTSSQLGHSPPPHFEDVMSDNRHPSSTAIMTGSFYGNLPEDPLKQLLQEHTVKKVSDPIPIIGAASGKTEDVITKTALASSFKSYSPQDITSAEDTDFEKALHEHRIARGEDFTPKASKVTYVFESKSSPGHTFRKGTHQSPDVNGQKNYDDDDDCDFTGSNLERERELMIGQGVHDKLNGKPSIESTSVTTYHISAEPSSSVKKVTKTTTTITSSGEEHDPMFHHQTSSSLSSAFPEPPKGFGLPATKAEDLKDPIEGWGKPLGLPAPIPPPTNDTDTSAEIVTSTPSNKGTPKKEKKSSQTKKTMLMNENNKIKDSSNRKRPESPVKQSERKGSSANKDTGLRNAKATGSPIYVDLTYVPHHGNSYYSSVEFFKKVRARYYVFSGTDPSRDVYNALLEAKQTWDDKELEALPGLKPFHRELMFKMFMYQYYVERLEHYSKANKAKDEERCSVLLTLLGPKTYAVLKNLCVPNKPRTKSCAELVEIACAHYAPKKIVIAERKIRPGVVQQKSEDSVQDSDGALAIALRKCSGMGGRRGTCRQNGNHLAARCPFAIYIGDACKKKRVILRGHAGLKAFAGSEVNSEEFNVLNVDFSEPPPSASDLGHGRLNDTCGSCDIVNAALCCRLPFVVGRWYLLEGLLLRCDVTAILKLYTTANLTIDENSLTTVHSEYHTHGGGGKISGVRTILTLTAKKVTIIPTYDTDTLGYWVAENEDTLAKCKIDLSPSASRCTINLQDHETSCSAYRLEF